MNTLEHTLAGHDRRSDQSSTKKIMISSIEHLSQLVAFNTQNPPRKITCDSPIFNYLKQHLSGFQFSFIDDGNGCISLLALRGNPELLFNFHIDTVPVARGWTSDPFQLVITKDKAIGLGACDIKGASACMLSAANKTQQPLGLLFSSDEEHGSSVAVKQFLKTEHGFKQVIVAEPTQAKAIVAHRGIQTATVQFIGQSGHGSSTRALKDNAIHKATKWLSNTLDWVEKQTFKFENLTGLPFNVGKIDGGIKANMIAATCELKLGFRPLPGQSSSVLINQLKILGKQKTGLSEDEFEITAGFNGPTLPADNQVFSEAIEQSTNLAKAHQLTVGNAVNFWTEASLFSQAGLTAFVYGPGNIEQAHTANEWVSLQQLSLVEKSYIQIIESAERQQENLLNSNNNIQHSEQQNSLNRQPEFSATNPSGENDVN